MVHTVSIRLDDDTRQTLQDQAVRRGLGLSSLLRELAEAEAKRLRRDRIRMQSREVGEHVARSAKARAFYGHWGTPAADER